MEEVVILELEAEEILSTKGKATLVPLVGLLPLLQFLLAISLFWTNGLINPFEEIRGVLLAIVVSCEDAD